MTPEALARAEEIVSELLHSHDTNQDAEIIARALVAWDARPREPEACRVPEARGLHVGYPRQGGRAPDGGVPATGRRSTGRGRWWLSALPEESVLPAGTSRVLRRKETV
jgi:hypothetical protein